VVSVPYADNDTSINHRYTTLRVGFTKAAADYPISSILGKWASWDILSAGALQSAWLISLLRKKLGTARALPVYNGASLQLSDHARSASQLSDHCENDHADI